MIIRKPNPDNLTKAGIPKDFDQIMRYFNKGLREGGFPFIPRKTPISTKEIKELWVPSLETNVSLIGEFDGKVIGSVTAFYNLSSTAYNDADEREIGEVGLTVHPSYGHRSVGIHLMGSLAQELKKQDKSAILHTDIHFDEEIAIMSLLGHHGRYIENFERYQKAGLSGNVLRYNLP